MRKFSLGRINELKTYLPFPLIVRSLLDMKLACIFKWQRIFLLCSLLLGVSPSVQASNGSAGTSGTGGSSSNWFGTALSHVKDT